MAIRRLLASGALGLGLAFGTTVGLPTLVAASPTWCEDDPPVTITTPGGATVRVYITDFALLPAQASAADAIRQALKAATISATVAPADGGTGPEVTLQILVPEADGKAFVTRSVVTTEPNNAGTVLAKSKGKSGRGETLSFHVNVA